MKLQDVATGTYTLANGESVTIYNPRDCYLTWADGEIIKTYTECAEVKGDA